MPERLDLAISADRVILPSGERAATVGVRDGRIVSITRRAAGNEHRAAEVVELDDDVALLPGLVDCHVHVNEPGRTAWEGFATATRAAAAGGVTTIVDMPLNCLPPTVNVAALRTKQDAARDQCWVDVAFWGGAIPGNASDLLALHRAGVVGFKCFLAPSGVDEFPPLSANELAVHLHCIREFDGLMIAHAEDGETLDVAPKAGGRTYEAFLASRPRQAEQTAIDHLIDAAIATGARTHIVHLSNADAIGTIRAGRRRGARLTVETCPHYLVFSSEQIPAGATEYKCCPPIREAANREALWRALDEGDIDLVVSDHSPCLPALKSGAGLDFSSAWGGIASLQLGLAAVWTEARRRGHSLSMLVKLMAERPADLVGLPSKGRIAVGADADFSAFAPDETWVVDGPRLRHRHPLTPYEGRTLYGVVARTWLAGRPVGAEAPRGRLLTRAA